MRGTAVVIFHRAVNPQTARWSTGPILLQSWEWSSLKCMCTDNAHCSNYNQLGIITRIILLAFCVFALRRCSFYIHYAWVFLSRRVSDSGYIHTKRTRAQHHLYYDTKLCSEHYANEGTCSWYRHEYACSGNKVSSDEWDLRCTLS